MKKKVLFIVNPKSGKGSIRNKLLDVIDIFTKAEYDLTIYISQAVQDARNKVKDVGDRYDLIVCSGGDGTLDEVISGMIEKDIRCAIGYIPCGSTNDFARSLNLPTTITEAAERIVKWNEFPCDIGTYNNDYFIYVAAFGIFTAVSYETDQDMKNALGHLAYVLEGVRELTSIKSYYMTIETEEKTIDGDFIFGMVTNSISVGGFKNLTGKDVKLDDGVFEVTLIRAPHDILELNELIQAILAGKPDSRYVYQFTSKRIEFHSESEVPWTLDGEFGGCQNDVVISNKMHALTLLV